MNDAILCLSALFLLAWVIYLKYELGLLRAENEKLVEKLKKLVRTVGQGVETGDDMAVWGQRPPWLK
jgi:hypothetical protein